MPYVFRWNAWNVDHVARHGVTTSEAESVVSHGRGARREGDRYVVRGQTGAGRWLQVAYIFDPPGVVYVIHARPLTDREKRTSRRRRRP
jgi:uncharacterized DUF497 family protein